MRQRVHFLTEHPDSQDLLSLVHKYLVDFDVTLSKSLPDKSDEFCLIVLWNLPRKIYNLPAKRNIVVFHSSDLPNGRGWAPIYYALAENRKEHVITAILASEQVDSGEIIAKARFKIQSSYLADNLRKIDEEICIKMAIVILERIRTKSLRTKPQIGRATYYNRRQLADNKIDVERRFVDLIPHIRGCESAHPAFFDWDGCRYNIILVPETPPNFPDDVTIEFFDYPP
jgi:methionyl-tRNA formyltransferase